MRTVIEKYIIEAPAIWAGGLTDGQLLSKIAETDFSKKQIEADKDYCYYLRKAYYTDDLMNAEYGLMVYSINQPSTLEIASVNEQILLENEYLSIHRIAVFREGQLIDKINDTKIKTLDHEDQSNGGVFNSSKKINISIKDVRLYDIIIIEDTRNYLLTEKEFLRKAFVKFVWSSPDPYWGYGEYEFDFINERTKPVAYKKSFFRDDNELLIEDEEGLLTKGQRLEIRKQNYLNPIDVNREINPFIDFATQSTWSELANYIYPYYEEVLQKHDIASIAPALLEKINAYDLLEDKLQTAIEYVQNNIRYVYDADEMHGHKPQDPEITYANKQGDCKAKTLLLKILLDYLHIDSTIVLVNYANDYFLKHFLPSLMSFNHVILKISYQGCDYFIDATARDEFGTLENRTFISFFNYLEIKQGAELAQRKSFSFPKFCMEDQVDIRVLAGVGTLSLTSTYRYNRANNLRRYFKNTSKKEIIEEWNKFLFNNMNFLHDRNGVDIREVFTVGEIQILSDDKKLNEFKIQYTCTLPDPYFKNPKGARFLMYFDASVLRIALRDHLHKDVTFWHYYDSERYEIVLSTDKKIDTKEQYTVQECNLDNSYFKYSLKKDIHKYGGKAIIEYRPISNIEVPIAEIANLKAEYKILENSNYGLGLDIIEPGLLNFLKYSFK